MKNRIIEIANKISDAAIQLNDYTKLFPHTSLPQFEIHLVEHCNLNCKGCNNFSPIANEEFIDENIFSKEMQRMGILFSGYVGKIVLLGGEPLLHPNIIKLIDITRTNFPTTNIVIVTNGIKLITMPNDFWKACISNNIEISITKYPIVKNYNKIEKVLKDNNVNYKFFSETRKTFEKVPIDLNGSLDGNKMWLKCFKAINCASLKNGRLYPCSFASNIHHFCKKFNAPYLNEVPEDSIDIFTNTRKEIFEFLTHPIPMCRYCDIPNKIRGIPYGISTKKIDEWI